MKIIAFTQVLILIFIIQSCTSTSKISADVEAAYQEGNYAAVLSSLEPIIESRESKGKKAKGPIYVVAGKSALALKQDDKARKYLESAKSPKFSSAELYESLAQVYRSIDNLSKEITALETYYAKYPQGKNIDIIRERLFETYVESKNWDLAIKLWPEIETQAQSSTELLASYLIVNKTMKNTAKADKLALQILKLDTRNLTALEYYAEKHFWLAENLYLSEMKAYKKKRTQSQYKKLLKALKKTGIDYNKSLDYFLKLYKIKPKAEYAKYLGNIYTRLDNKQKAKYYYGKAK